MSPRLLLLRSRAGRASRGLSGSDWLDAQAAAARMLGRSRGARLMPRGGRADRARLAEPARVRAAVVSNAAR
jgi:hypothetical protein